jgi:predicted metalloprotease
VALNFFTDVYSRAIASQAQVLGVEVGSWTWPVTGQSYGDAAVVVYAIPVVDEAGQASWVEETIYFVRHDGRWAWFLGSSAEFVNAILDQYAGLPAPSGTLQQGQPFSDLPVDQVLESIIYDVDAYFAEVVGFTDFTYESPGVVIVPQGRSAMSACGPATTGFFGFYCPVDQTIYLDEPFLIDLVQNQSAFSAAFVIAHEWAHHVQTGIGLERTTRPTNWNQVHSIELELMADCFAAAWARDAELRGLISAGDIISALNSIVFDLGDPKFVGELDPQAHGTGEQRVRAALNGYEDGFPGCNILIEGR